MTPEAQRIAIAEACGWTWRLVPATKDGPDNPYGEFQHTWWTNPKGEEKGVPPDYLNDLNAMHEAEKILDTTNGGPTSGDCLRYVYCRELYKLVPEWMQPFRATAAQRAEAFLRAIGKWKN